MTLRRWLALVLIGVGVAISPLAHSELPDQIWQGGVYDGADDDDAFDHVTSELSVVEPVIVYDSPLVQSVLLALPQSEMAAPDPALPSQQTRAPPAH